MFMQVKTPQGRKGFLFSNPSLLRFDGTWRDCIVSRLESWPKPWLQPAWWPAGPPQRLLRGFPRRRPDQDGRYHSTELAGTRNFTEQQFSRGLLKLIWSNFTLLTSKTLQLFLGGKICGH